MRVYSEIAEADIEFFPDYLRGSTITLCFSLFETLLGDVANQVARDLGVDVNFEERKIPYIDQHILWLKRSCGLDIQVDKKLWKELAAVRELRNRFIHRMDRDLPPQVRDTLNTLSNNEMDDNMPSDDEHVNATMKTVSDLAKRVELAYWKFVDAQE